MLNCIKLIQDSSLKECIPGAFYCCVSLNYFFLNSVYEIYPSEIFELLPIHDIEMLVFYFILISKILKNI